MSTLYHSVDHLTVSGNGMWSDLFLLAETAVMVHEQEQRLRRRRGEDEIKSFFYLFPRRKRSSLAIKRQNPDRTSLSLYSSSSSLNNYLKKRPQNPSFCDLAVVVYDADHLRAKKGKSKVVYDYRDDDDEKRLFLEKNVTRFVRRNFDNLDGSSSSSTYLRDSRNQRGGKKRRALLQPSKNGRQFKKAKLASFTRRTNPQTPDWIFQVMRRMSADSQNPMLIFERALTASDVAAGQSRLLLPFQQLIRNDFLTPGESRAVDKEEYNENDDETIGVGSIFVNQRCEKLGMRFKIWAMDKETGHGTLNYALNWGWNDVIKGNHLKQGDKIALWTFRWRGVLCFALETY